MLTHSYQAKLPLQIAKFMARSELQNACNGALKNNLFSILVYMAILFITHILALLCIIGNIFTSGKEN